MSSNVYLAEINRLTTSTKQSNEELEVAHYLSKYNGIVKVPNLFLLFFMVCVV